MNGAGRSLLNLPERIGRYQVDSVLGVGGFAVVVKAYDEGLDAVVAVKVLSETHAFDLDIRERFLNEARLLRKVRNNHVIDVHDIGQLEDGRPFFVMEYAGGGVLATRCGPGHPPPDVAEIRRVVDALADGLGALHAAGVVHRDVKPANLLIVNQATGPAGGLLAASERLVVGDLGLAKDQSLTAFGPTMLGGTPLYVAPEQEEIGARVSPASDVYSATAVLWNLVTGEAPPPAQQVATRLIGAPRPWRAVLERGMAREPEHRYASMEEWRAAATLALGVSPQTGVIGASVLVATASTAVCPYKGLAAFQAEDAELFFGRDAVIDELVARLARRSVLVVGGASGSGKSSVVRAGLVPRLHDGALPGSQHWSIIVLTPGTDPLAEFHQHLTTVGIALPPLDHVRKDPACLRALADRGDLVIVIDQFEELFTLVGDPRQRRAFLDAIAALTHGDRVRVVLALRADFYGLCAEDPWLAKAINDSQLLVGPLGRAELHAAIEGPARRVGLRLEDGLADTILDEAGHDPGSLPLVAHALMETWLRRQGNLLTLNGYRASGGVTGAIAQRADQVIDRLEPADQRVARDVLLALVNPMENGVDTRRRATWATLGDTPPSRAVVATLADARLLTVDTNSVEVAHEALITTWPRYRGWIDEARDDLRTRDRLAAAAVEWDRQQRTPDLLFRGTPLAAALDWRAASRQQLPPITHVFLDAAEQAKQTEQQQAETEERTRRRTRRRAVSALAAVTAAALVASVIAFVALGQSRTNARREKAGFIRALATTADGLATSDPMLATILAAESASRTTPPSLEARRALADSRSALANGRLIPDGDSFDVGDARNIALNPKGDLLFAGRRDGTIGVWNTVTRTAVGDLTGPKKAIEKLAVDPTGRWLLAGADDGVVWRWDLRAAPAQRIGKPIVRAGNIVWSVAIAPNGRSFAIATEGGSVALFELPSGRRLGDPVRTTQGEFLAVTYTAEGNVLIVSDGHQGTVFVWDLPSRRLRFPPFLAHTSQVWEIMGSERANQLVTNDGQTIKVWDLTTGAPISGPFSGETRPFRGVAPKGLSYGAPGHLVFGGDDGRLHDWSFAPTETPYSTEARHDSGIVATARSANGDRFASFSADHRARLWTTTPRPVHSRVARLADPLYSVVLDGSSIAVGGESGVVHLLDPVSGRELGQLPGHSGRIFAIADLRPGQLITGDTAGTVRRWDTRAHRVVAVSSALSKLRSATSASPEVTGIGVAPNKKQLAAVSANGMVLLRDDLSVVKQVRAEGLRAVSYAPDGQSLVTASSDGTLQRWTASGVPLGPATKASQDALWAVAFSPDGTTLAAGDDGETVSLWAVTKKGVVLRHRLPQHSLGAVGLAFLSNDSLGVSTKVGTVRLWDVSSGSALGAEVTLPTKKTIWHLAADRSSLVTAGKDGVVHRIDALDINAACRLARGSFDESQRRRYLGDQRVTACGP